MPSAPLSPPESFPKFAFRHPLKGDIGTILNDHTDRPNSLHPSKNVQQEAFTEGAGEVSQPLRDGESPCPSNAPAASPSTKSGSGDQ